MDSDRCHQSNEWVKILQKVVEARSGKAKHFQPGESMAAVVTMVPEEVGIESEPMALLWADERR